MRQDYGDEAGLGCNLMVEVGRLIPCGLKVQGLSCESGGMRSGISFTPSNSERLRLEALVADRNMPQKHAWWARIVLLSAVGLGTHGIMREAGVSKTVVWR